MFLHDPWNPLAGAFFSILQNNVTIDEFYTEIGFLCFIWLFDDCKVGKQQKIWIETAKMPKFLFDSVTWF